PDFPPRLEPRPAAPEQFFQGMLEGIAAIEKAAYDRLENLGCPPPRRVITIGGGAANRAWSRIRRRTLGIPVSSARHGEPAWGAARIARAGALGETLLR
ncbi:MAG: FGGY-family carbohydrate kinase, partial [Pseudomonadota bacterium]